MRRRKRAGEATGISILALDDDNVMTLTIQAYFRNSGYHVDTENDPRQAIERVREGEYDILLLDFLMTPICGDQVVEEIRRFNSDIYIVMLTGHKSMAPPLKTIRQLDIQGYYEKSDRFDQLELLVESCVKSIRQMRLIRSYHNGLAAMLAAMPEINSLHTMDELARTLVSSGESFFTDVRFGLAVTSSPSGPLESPVIYGSLSELTPETIPELAGREEGTETELCTARLSDEHERCIGLLAARFPQLPTPQQRQLFTLYAKQSASAILNVLLHVALEDKNREITAANERLNANLMEIIRAIRLLVDAKDIYTRGHSDRVAFLACRLASELGRSDDYIATLHVAGLFHDVGKVAVPDAVLTKPEALSEEEYALIKEHPARGAGIVSSLSAFSSVADAIRHHHEHYDGSGYPDGIAGTRICEEARILAIADAFDAMTSDRSYRSALSLEQALSQLREGRGTQFDPEMTDVFLNRVLCDAPALMRELAAIDESM